MLQPDTPHRAHHDQRQKHKRRSAAALSVVGGYPAMREHLDEFDSDGMEPVGQVRQDADHDSELQPLDTVHPQQRSSASVGLTLKVLHHELVDTGAPHQHGYDA
jgi:hypothetical protein